VPKHGLQELIEHYLMHLKKMPIFTKLNAEMRRKLFENCAKHNKEQSTKMRMFIE